MYTHFTILKIVGQVENGIGPYTLLDCMLPYLSKCPNWFAICASFAITLVIQQNPLTPTTTLLQKPAQLQQLLNIDFIVFAVDFGKMATNAADLRKEIRAIQMRRKHAQLQHEKVVNDLQQQLHRSQVRLRNATECQRRNSRSLYAEILEEMMGPCRPTEEARLVEVSHMIEINEHLLEIMVMQYRNLTDYMVCEINVLEQERTDIQEKHAAKYTLLMEEMARFNDSFGAPSKPAQERRRASMQPSELQRRSSCGTARRASVGSNTSALRRLSSMFRSEDCDDLDDLSVVSDLSMSCASIQSCTAGKSVGTTETVSSRGDLDSPYSTVKKPALIVPEEERFTVIKL